MKKTLIGMAAALIIALQTLTVSAQTFSGGVGTSDSPYLITTTADLHALSAAVNNGNNFAGRFFRLENDISFFTQPFTPIGYFKDSSDCAEFSGTFDGNGKAISGFSIIASDSDNVGFFGCVAADWNALSMPVIKNLGVTGFLVIGDLSVGGLVGAADYAIIENCYAADGVVEGGDYTGGLVGYNNGSILFSYATVGVYAKDYGDYTGGLVGMNTNYISNCYAGGKVSGNGYVGGLVGQHYEGNIYNAYSYAYVSGSYYVGGVVGYNAVLDGISRCYFDCDAAELDDRRGIGNGYIGDVRGYYLNYAPSSSAFIAELNAVNDVWLAGNSATNHGYPILNWQKINPVPVYHGYEINVCPMDLPFRKPKFSITYPNPPKKDKKIASKYKQIMWGILAVKGSVPLYDKKAYKAARKTMFTCDILDTGLVTQTPLAVTIFGEDHDSTDSMPGAVVPPMIREVQFSANSDYMFVRTYHVGDKSKFTMEYNKGTADKPKIATASLKAYDIYDFGDDDFYDMFGFYACDIELEYDFENCYVLKLNPKVMQRDDRIDVVVDNKNGFSAVFNIKGF